MYLEDKIEDNNPIKSDEIENEIQDEEVQEKLNENEDFLSFQEINWFIHYQNKDTALPGFRKGRTPTFLLHARNPEITQYLINFYLQSKAEKHPEKDVKIAEITEEANGLKIVYTIVDKSTEPQTTA